MPLFRRRRSRVPASPTDRGPTPGPSSSVGDRFHAAWTSDDDPATASPEMLPSRLARACVATLPVTAAGLSLFDHEFRVPLGASDETASAAERLQFTQGEGPCLDAAAAKAAQAVELEEIYRRWPAFAQRLEDSTPYRAILSVPLHLSPTVGGAIDLYFADPADVRALALTDVVTVLGQITDALASARAVSTGDPVPDNLRPAWLGGPAAHDRTQVWIAMGMVMTSANLEAADALALLRSHAYGHDRVLDDVARDLLEGRLQLDEITV